MLSQRRKRILETLVEEYVHSAQPVGSKALVERYDLQCSAATVRNELAALEETGYLHQPHTSAGRVPTDAGYRAFVDELEERTTPSVGEVESVAKALRGLDSELEDLLKGATALLSRLTNQVAVVLAPTLRRSRVMRIDLVSLSPDRVLVVLITDDGQVGKRAIGLDSSMDADEVRGSEQLLNRMLEGRLAEELRELRLDFAAHTDRAAGLIKIMDALLASLEGHDEEAVFHDGAQALLGEPEFAEPTMVRGLVGMLEDGMLLVRAFSEVLDVRDVLVRIGRENTVAGLDHMTVIASTYGQRGGEGFVGLLGPTRMDYTRAIGSVRAVAGRLSDTLDPR